MKRLIIVICLILLHLPVSAQVKCNGGLHIKMTHKATVVRGNAVMLDFLLTNRLPVDIDMSFINSSTNIVDNIGNTYSGSDIQFDFANTGLAKGMLPGGASVKLRCIINNIDDSTRSFWPIALKYKCSLSEGEEWILWVRKVKLDN